MGGTVWCTPRMREKGLSCSRPLGLVGSIFATLAEPALATVARPP